MLGTVFLLLSMTIIRMSLSVAEKRSEGSARVFKLSGEALELAIIAIGVVFLVIRPFMAQAYYIPSGSMQPTLRENDRILVDMLAGHVGTLHHHDVVVFRAPDAALVGEDRDSTDETDFIKRVIGLPGDTVETHHGVTYVNGVRQKESYCREAPFYEMGPYLVPPGKIFVMGDNRNHSNDSSRWGALDESMVVGRALMVYWPPSRIGAIR